MTDNIKFVPIAGTNNRLIIKRDEQPKEEKIGSIIVTASLVKVKLTGKVIAVSESDDTDRLPKVKVGDHVMFDEHSVKPIFAQPGVELLTCRESSVIAVLKGE